MTQHRGRCRHCDKLIVIKEPRWFIFGDTLHRLTLIIHVLFKHYNVVKKSKKEAFATTTKVIAKFLLLLPLQILYLVVKMITFPFWFLHEGL